MRRDASAETTSLGKRRRSRAGRGEAARLVNAAELFRETLRPAARNRRVIVDEYEWAEVDRSILEDRFDQGKGLAILIARRIGQFIVRTGELPVEEPEEGAPAGFVVWSDAGWEEGRDRRLIGPILDRDAITGIVPRRQCRERGF